MNFDKENFDVRIRETSRYLKKLKSADELIFVTTAHLLTEYILNMIIEHKCKNPEKLMGYQYSKKLDILFCVDLIPDYLYEDLCQLNSLRNKFAHNLYPKPQIFSFKTVNWGLPEIIVAKYDVKSNPYKGIPYKEFLSDMCVSIFFLLFQHAFYNLKIDISFKRLEEKQSEKK